MDDEATWFKSMNAFMPPKALLNKHPGFESFQELIDARTTDDIKFFKVSKRLFFLSWFLHFSLFSYLSRKSCASILET